MLFILTNMGDAAVLISIIALILKPELSHGLTDDDRKPWTSWVGVKTYTNLENRLLETMQSHIILAEQIIEPTNDMRFMYEESPQYEMGYIIGEIIERYRKMVEFTKLYTKYNFNHTDIVFKMVYRLEVVQKIYFETYHLVQMLNEIPRKYEHMAEFKDIHSNVDHDEVMRQYKKEERQKKSNEKSRKKMAKMYKKLSDAYAKSQRNAYVVRQSPENKRWPLDYGWEIDPNWPELVW